MGFLSHDPLPVGELIDAARRNDAGGLAVFIGAVRDHARGRSVVAIDYSAYEPMAERVYQQIVDEVAERWPDVTLHSRHRIGHLRVGDDAVVIVASSAHRPECFAACRHVIERLKEDCPIWKKEWDAGGAQWISPRP